jgi:phage head maturation protease
MPIGIWLDMSEDSHGLRLKGKLANTKRGRDTYALLKMKPRPALDGLSIGYLALIANCTARAARHAVRLRLWTLLKSRS